MADLLLIIHDPESSAGTTLEWCRSRGLSFDLRVAEDIFADQSIDISKYEGLIVFGGDMQVWETAKYPWLKSEKRFIKESIAAGHPVLGLCLGGQLIAEQTGGDVQSCDEGWEIGWNQMHRLGTGKVESATVLSWHSSRLKPSDDAEVIVSNVDGKPEAVSITPKVLGFQFHLEIDEKRLAHALEGYDDNAKGRVQTREQLIQGFRENKNSLKTLYFEILDSWWEAGSDESL